MQYPSIRIEGAIISAELISQLDGDTDMRGQKSTDFGLANGTRVKDDIAIRWADAQNYYRIYKQRATLLRQTDPGTTLTRNNWMVPLLGLFGFEIEPQSGLSINNQTYAISHRASNRANTPIYIIGANDPAGLDRKPANATRRMSAHAILQEYLNLSESLYGIVSNGRVLRVLRDSSRLVKQSYLEFDLERIFEDGLYADFAILYRLVHASRFPLRIEATAECLLERYHQDSLDAGARIRDGLSKAVELAILTLANGFLEHPDNQALHHAIATNALTATQYYQELLRLIYRMLFLMVVEERNLIFPVDAKPAHVKIYANGYAIQRLRTRSEKPYTTSKQHTDLWFGLLATFRLFQSDGNGTSLGIAPLAGALFATSALAHIGQAQISNDTLARAVAALNSYQNPRGGATRVNYGALNVEEFGSVYEGLLEYAPQLTATAHGYTFSFVAGQDRAASGSHYTPDDLVQPLIKHSLDYLIEDCRVKPDSAAALLDLRVADIACGSGHILLAAARRIATALATARTGEEQPSPSAYRNALRDTIRQCIYGVDLNPLAVELCKVALWIEAHEPGKPLNFLDHHIKCGNSIVGFVSLDDVAKGVPDEAFTATPQDNKDIASTLRKANREARKTRNNSQMNFAPAVYNLVEQFQKTTLTIAQMPEQTADDVALKSDAYQAMAISRAMADMRSLADIPIAQFYIPKTAEYQQVLTTDGAFVRTWQGSDPLESERVAVARQMAVQKRFFHWFLEFPDIVARGGFDCILGNPPYLGGQALSGTYGHAFCNYVKIAYAPTGLSDLVVFFVRRIYTLLQRERYTAFITTNSIKDGDVRKDGLEQVLADGGSIHFAIRGMKWPGKANLVVSLVGLYRGAWSSAATLDGISVPKINSFFEAGRQESEPTDLGENADKVIQGTIVLGDGFLLSHIEADELCAFDEQNRQVIQKIMNGQEINNDPNQNPGRSVINFFDMSNDKASSYKEPFGLVEVRVKPLREKQIDEGGRKKWWQFLRPRIELYKLLKNRQFCFVAAATTKYLNFSAMPKNIVFTHALYVFTTDRWDLYSVVQSTIHEVWARKYSGSLAAVLRYSPSECFETYAFPAGIWQQAQPELATIGAQYHEHRRQLMRHLWLGLTDVYNLFHSPRLDEAVQKHYASRARKDPQGLAIPAEHRAAALAYSAAQALADIQQLRALHVALDTAVLAAYGWSDLDLAHDFYDVDTLPENDRTRYTISPTARRELLSRLLTENHARAAQEARDVTLTTRKTTSKKLRGGTKGDANQSELF
jgi:hypothetical protein